MSDFLSDLAKAGPLSAAGTGNPSSDGIEHVTRMVTSEEWSNHLLQLRNDVRQSLAKVDSPMAGTWNQVAVRVGPRVDAEIVPAIRKYAETHGLDADFVDSVRYGVMTVAMADAYRDEVSLTAIDQVKRSFLSGRIPCAYRNGQVISY